MAHPYNKQTKTGQEIADARYGSIGNENAAPAQREAATAPEEVFIGAPPRQVSNTGKVRK